VSLDKISDSHEFPSSKEQCLPYVILYVYFLEDSVLSLSFHSPPVIETVLSVQFEELEKFRNVHFGHFHSLVSPDFPLSDDRPRLPRIFESFPAIPQMQRLKFQQAGGEPDRVWYRTSGESPLMLQVQPDRFSLNWCKHEGQSYPQYNSYRPEFIRRFEQFGNFAEEFGLGKVVPNLCEVSYINHIIPNEGESPSECCSAVLAGVAWVSADGWLPQPPETISFNRTFPILSNLGRLYVEVYIANIDQRDAVVLKITARTICGDVPPALDLAHEWVVKSFVSLTTEKSRKERWGEQ